MAGSLTVDGGRSQKAAELGVRDQLTFDDKKNGAGYREIFKCTGEALQPTAEDFKSGLVISNNPPGILFRNPKTKESVYLFCGEIEKLSKLPANEAQKVFANTLLARNPQLGKPVPSVHELALLLADALAQKPNLRGSMLEVKGSLYTALTNGAYSRDGGRFEVSFVAVGRIEATPAKEPAKTSPQGNAMRGLREPNSRVATIVDGQLRGPSLRAPEAPPVAPEKPKYASVAHEVLNIRPEDTMEQLGDRAWSATKIAVPAGAAAAVVVAFPVLAPLVVAACGDMSNTNPPIEPAKAGNANAGQAGGAGKLSVEGGAGGRTYLGVSGSESSSAGKVDATGGHMSFGGAAGATYTSATGAVTSLGGVAGATFEATGGISVGGQPVSTGGTVSVQTSGGTATMTVSGGSSGATQTFTGGAPVTTTFGAGGALIVSFGGTNSSGATSTSNGGTGVAGSAGSTTAPTACVANPRVGTTTAKPLDKPYGVVAQENAYSQNLLSAFPNVAGQQAALAAYVGTINGGRPTATTFTNQANVEDVAYNTFGIFNCTLGSPYAAVDFGEVIKRYIRNEPFPDNYPVSGVINEASLSALRKLVGLAPGKADGDKFDQMLAHFALIPMPSEVTEDYPAAYNYIDRATVGVSKLTTVPAYRVTPSGT